MKKSWIFLILLTGVFAVTTLHKTIFPVRYVEISGTEFLKKEMIISLIPQNESLFSIKREALAKKIMDLGLVEKVQISIGLLDKLFIRIQEKSLIGKLTHKEKKYYLTAKGYVLSEKSYILDKHLPEIKLKNKLENSKLLILCNNLELIKFHDPNFFSKIEKISFDGIENSYIFIRINQKEYVLNTIFKLEDILKVRLLDRQKLAYQIFDLRENDMIVVKN